MCMTIGKKPCKKHVWLILMLPVQPFKKLAVYNAGIPLMSTE